jgi:hypothetical protein
MMSLIRKQLPIICPSCQGLLKVQRLTCDTCATTVGGSFDLPVLARLPEEDQAFIIRLIEASGSLKAMARVYGISYPTVRNRLDSLIDKIAQIRKKTDAEAGEGADG